MPGGIFTCCVHEDFPRHEPCIAQLVMQRKWRGGGRRPQVLTSHCLCTPDSCACSCTPVPALLTTRAHACCVRVVHSLTCTHTPYRLCASRPRGTRCAHTRADSDDMTSSRAGELARQRGVCTLCRQHQCHRAEVNIMRDDGCADSTGIIVCRRTSCSSPARESSTRRVHACADSTGVIMCRRTSCSSPVRKLSTRCVHARESSTHVHAQESSTRSRRRVHACANSTGVIARMRTSCSSPARELSMRRVHARRTSRRRGVCMRVSR
jgi:hypothetical protein